MRRWGLGWLALGLVTGLAALWAGSPPHWSAKRVQAAVEDAVAGERTAEVRRWLPSLVSRWRDRPDALIATGALVFNLSDPGILIDYADLVDRRATASTALAASAALWRAQAAIMREDLPTARSLLEDVRARFWDHHQALEAEAMLEQLAGRAPTEAVSAAAAGGDWRRVIELAADVEEKRWLPADRDLVAAHLLEALFALGHANEATDRVVAWSAPGAGFNVPAVVQPVRLAAYPAAGRALEEAVAKLAPDNRWHPAVKALADALAGRWDDLAAGLSGADPAASLGAVDHALRGRLDQPTGERLLAAMAARTDLRPEQRLQLQVQAARFRLASGDRTGARQAIDDGIAILPSDPATGELAVLALELAADRPVAERVRDYEAIIESWERAPNVVLRALGEAQQLLVESGRRGEACALGRRHVDKLPDPVHRRAALQVCPLE